MTHLGTTLVVLACFRVWWLFPDWIEKWAQLGRDRHALTERRDIDIIPAAKETYSMPVVPPPPPQRGV